MKISLRLAIIAIALFSISCSQRQAYEAIQANQVRECNKQPHAAQEECVERVNKPYETYKREREEALEQ